LYSSDTLIIEADLWAIGRVCELSEPVNGLARIKFSRAPALGLVRTVQVPARPAETGRTRISSTANPSRRRHPLRSSGEKLAREPGRDRWRRGAAAQASVAAALVGKGGKRGWPPLTRWRRRGGAAPHSLHRGEEARQPAVDELGEDPTALAGPLRHRRAHGTGARASRRSAFPLHR
jgi:hypothetical protein